MTYIKIKSPILATTLHINKHYFNVDFELVKLIEKFDGSNRWSNPNDYFKDNKGIYHHHNEQDPRYILFELDEEDKLYYWPQIIVGAI